MEIKGHPILKKVIANGSTSKPCNVARPLEGPCKEECCTEIIAIISAGYAEGISHAVWKAYMCGTQQVMATVSISTMVFDGYKGHAAISTYDDPMAVELKVANALVRIILDSLKNLKHPRKDITPLVHPILGVGCSSVTPVVVIDFPLLFRDKTKSWSIEVDFLVVEVPPHTTTYRPADLT
ncbi:hypothetical protein Cgig2_017312 [Carnegiea gigantea]|uniref:Uncharacterized protein n=1 Tax=Carnegiea gigantea TaxID=171969 RepID=A0A9Q1JJA9_9CARY|nr:hypothetical protein Cgig2_012313 [Carnegiea gigantea]KAJ8427607.1 hypothetical protein Cgig2_017312 [Carnegiea gigantea]